MTFFTISLRRRRHEANWPLLPPHSVRNHFTRGLGDYQWRECCKILGVNTYFPFHALGLQCNPFRALTDEEWGDIALLPEELLTLEPTAHVQILGERGHGKTSLLMGLAAMGRQQHKKAAYEYLAA